MAKRKSKEANGEVEQGYLSEEMAPVKNNRVHKAAKRYAGLRDARIAAGREEKASHDTLLTTMGEEGVEEYQYGDLKVSIDLKRKAKVKIGREDTAPAEEEEAEE